MVHRHNVPCIMAYTSVYICMCIRWYINLLSISSISPISHSSSPGFAPRTILSRHDEPHPSLALSNLSHSSTLCFRNKKTKEVLKKEHKEEEEKRNHASDFFLLDNASATTKIPAPVTPPSWQGLNTTRRRPLPPNLRASSSSRNC